MTLEQINAAIVIQEGLYLASLQGTQQVRKTVLADGRTVEYEKPLTSAEQLSNLNTLYALKAQITANPTTPPAPTLAARASFDLSS